MPFDCGLLIEVVRGSSLMSQAKLRVSRAV
jgi:hypothetical protein